jgi:hypothetical protein
MSKQVHLQESADLITGHTPLCKQIATAGQIFVCLANPYTFSPLDHCCHMKGPFSAAKSLLIVCRLAGPMQTFLGVWLFWVQSARPGSTVGPGALYFSAVTGRLQQRHR